MARVEPTRIDGLASEQHFEAHLAPIWRELERCKMAGSFHTTAAPLPPGDRPVLVASYGDLKRATNRRVILAEHGAGQTYSNQSPSYSGGKDREQVALFLCPSERVAAKNRAVYPAARYAVVGCPGLDRWHARLQKGRRHANRHLGQRAKGTVVALTWHWEMQLVPEGRSAYPFYAEEVPRAVESLRAAGCEVIGHSHPRAWRYYARRYRAMGVEAVRDLAEVFDRADVLVADNTSALYEFASLDRPVVVLNAPWYRRKIQHGLRFWEFADVGLQVDDPAQLADTVFEAIRDRPAQRKRRLEIVDQVYAHRDGHAAERAAAAIRSLLR